MGTWLWLAEFSANSDKVYCDKVCNTNRPKNKLFVHELRNLPARTTRRRRIATRFPNMMLVLEARSISNRQ